MEVLYGFRRYPVPRTGIFHITTDVYGPEGWVLKEESYTIIGEDKDTYVYRLSPSSHGELEGEVVVEKHYILPIGIHKSRLVRWADSTQLSLFD